MSAESLGNQGPRQSAVVFAVLVVASVLLLILRLPVIGVPALWIDEAFSLYHARLPLSQLWGEGWRLESSPPLYYTALWAWIRVATDSEPSSRLFSLLLTALTTILVYRAARALAGPIAGPIAGAVAVLAWLLPALGLEFSLEIRPYALQQCWIAIATWACISLLTLQTSGQSPGVSVLARRVAPIVLACTAAFYTHTTSLVFILSLAGASLYFGWATKAGVRYFQIWLGTCVITALVCLPQIFAASGVLATNRPGLAWIPPSLNLITLSRLLREITLGSHYWSLSFVWPMVLLVLAALAFSISRVHKQAHVIAICVVMPIIGAVLLVLAGLVQPILLSRTALWLWIPLAMLFGCAAVTLDWRRRSTRLMTTILAGIFLFSSLDYLDGRAEQRPWSNSIADIGRRAVAGDRVLVIDPEVACLVDHYAHGPLHDLPRLRLDLGAGQVYRSRQRLDIVCNRLPEIGLLQVATEPSGGDWILTDGPWQRSDLTNFLAATRGSMRVTDIIKGAGQVQATRVVRVRTP